MGVETVDPDGRDVILSENQWAHVLVRHPYITVGPEDIVDAVTRPDARIPGPEEGEEWFYRRGLGPSVWIRVVVHYEHGSGLIVTAFPRRLYP